MRGLRLAALLLLAALATLPASVEAQEGSAPTITGLSPSSGSPGTVVTITGTDLSGATAVSFGSVAAQQFTVDSATQIRATAPVAVPSGPITVEVGAQRATSATAFTLAAPAITNVVPVTGAVGTDVTITGTHLGGATELRIGSATAQFAAGSPTQIVAKVPAGATSGLITVITAGGTTTSSAAFAVQPTLTSFAPASGEADARITITGSGFAGALEVTIGGIPTAFSMDSPTQITVLVPPDAATGRIVVSVPSTGTSSPGAAPSIATSSSLFTVLPKITGFSPTQGTLATVVTITGSNFRGATAVNFGSAGSTFTVVSPTQISATVPPGANTGPISVRTPSGQSISTTTFMFVASGVLGEFEDRTLEVVDEMLIPESERLDEELDEL